MHTNLSMHHPSNFFFHAVFNIFVYIFNQDTDRIVVGYSQTAYTTTEGQRIVDLCATISTPSDGISPQPFVINASTSDGTAGTLYEQND